MSVDPVAFVEEHGIVMQSAQHATIPSLASAIAGEPIKGSWWAHARGRDIFRALNTVYDSPDVVATNLVDGKLTLIHRRLWPALASLTYEGRIEPARMAKVTQEHTESGRHEKHEEPFPQWLPKGLQRMNAAKAIVILGAPLAASLLRPGGEVPPSPVSGARAARARRR